jgi:hypothetical protein
MYQCSSEINSAFKVAKCLFNDIFSPVYLNRIYGVLCMAADYNKPAAIGQRRLDFLLILDCLTCFRIYFSNDRSFISRAAFFIPV